MGTVFFGLFGLLFGLLFAFAIIIIWAGFDMMFGVGFSGQAAQGLCLVMASAGALAGAVLGAIFS